MATIKLRSTIEIVPLTTVVSLPTTEEYELYEIISTGTITTGAVAFQTTGTLVDGLTYKFKYLANISSGSVSFMGEPLPYHLLTVPCEVEAFYNGVSWDVNIVPDFAENGIISNIQLETSPGTHVVAVAQTAVYTSINVAGVQTLTTVTIPANTLGTTSEAFRITAWGTCPAATSKSLAVSVTTGAFTNTLFQGNNTALLGNFKIEIIVNAIPPGAFQSESLILGGDQLPTGYNANNITWDYTLPQVISFNVTENVPTGGLVVLRQLRVEKIVY